MSFGPAPRAAAFGTTSVRVPPHPPAAPAHTDNHDFDAAPTVSKGQEFLSPVVRSALAYAERGWPVFPCRARSKAPATPHGFEDATTDPVRIRELFDHADYNIGIATGPAGLVVLDVDGDVGKQSFEALKVRGEIPATLTIKTRTGGRHYYFSRFPSVNINCSQGTEKRGLAPGIDVRAIGGYVIAPPSFVDADKKGGAGHYDVELDSSVAQLPCYLARILRKPTAARKQQQQQALLSGSSTSDAFPPTADNIEKIRKCLERRIAMGGWDNEAQWFLTLLEVRSLRDLAGWPDLTAWTIFDYWSQKVGGNYDSERNRRRWDHNGPPTDTPRTFRSLLQASIDPAEYQHERMAPDAINVAGPDGIDAETLSKKVFPPLVWVIDGILPEGCYLLSARPKVGKSWLALQMALSVAHGTSMWNSTVAQGVAVYLALEDNQRRLQSRLDTLRPGQWATKNLLLYTNWKRINQGGLKDIETLIVEKKPRLIIIDTLAKVRPIVGRNENAYQADYGALAPLTSLANKYRCSIVVVTHNRKGKSEDDPLEMISGTLGQAGAVDGAFVIEGKRGGETYTLTVAGRDIQHDGDFAIRKLQNAEWELLGPAGAVFASNERKRVLDLLKLTGPLKPKEIAERIGKRPGAIRELLRKMLGDMQIDVEQDGRYALPSP